MTSDLYQKPSLGAEFTSFCGGNNGSDGNEACVEFAEISGGFSVRDTKAPARGDLRFTEQELDNFALGWVAKRGL